MHNGGELNAIRGGCEALQRDGHRSVKPAARRALVAVDPILRSAPNSGRFSLAEIKRADDAARRVEHALEAPPTLDHSLRSLVVLATSLQQALEHFTVDWIDEPADKLQLLHNLSTNLAAAANSARDQVTIVLGTVLEYRLGDGTRSEESDTDLEALCRNVTDALHQLANGATEAAISGAEEASAIAVEASGGAAAAATKRPVTATPANEAMNASTHAALVSNEPVVANRRTGLYHAAGSPLIEQIASLNRIAFVSAAAAELSGFQPGQAPQSATNER